jgi:KUP system potassium uptake protein
MSRAPTTPPPRPPRVSTAEPEPARRPSSVVSHAPTGKLGALTLGALGIVFGDIGTSPLYTLSECTNAAHGVPPTPDNVLGVLSLIFWSLVMVVTVKYLTFIMRADNHGEGGILALLALIPERMRADRSSGKIGWVAILVIIGAALLYGDGMITPAISVLSAMEGLGVAAHALTPLVIPLTCAVLIALFAIQSRGTGQVGKLFGPVMAVWFVTIGGLGAYHVTRNPAVLHALSPIHAVRFFLAHGWHGFLVLGAVVLAVTGGEALYADMGHFGRRPIRLAWLCLVMPALVLNYFGQGALMLVDEQARANPFYAMVPSGGWTYALVALAAMATVIASQALISGAFSLTHQAVQLGFFPRVTITHTSSEAEGQIYAPAVNWGIAIVCITLVLSFEHSSRLAAAYGIAVTGTMGITSIVFFEVTRTTWRWPLWKGVSLLVLFLSFDIPFFVANLFKFLDGGYVPILVGAAFFTVMVTWKYGRRVYHEYIASVAPPLDAFIENVDRQCSARIPGAGVFMSATPDGVPTVMIHQVQRIRVLPETVVLLTVRIAHAPYIAADAMRMESLGKGFYRVIVEYGFMDRPDVPAALDLARERFSLPLVMPDLTYYFGRETFLATSKGRMGLWTEGLFAFLSRNASSATHQFNIPPEQVVELGSQIDL